MYSIWFLKIVKLMQNNCQHGGIDCSQTYRIIKISTL